MRNACRGNGSQPEERVQGGAGGGSGAGQRRAGEQAGTGQRPQVQDLLADPDPAARIELGRRVDRLNTPNGRFCNGKSGCPFALSTQLVMSGSWVTSRV